MNEILKILIYPAIASLNDYLALKIMRTLKNRPQELNVVKQIYKSYLNELVFSYRPFKSLVELQYSCDSLRHGPNLDNISYIFEFVQTEFGFNPAE